MSVKCVALNLTNLQIQSLEVKSTGKDSFVCEKEEHGKMNKDYFSLKSKLLRLFFREEDSKSSFFPCITKLYYFTNDIFKMEIFLSSTFVSFRLSLDILQNPFWPFLM